jgi:hypothetical protein
MLSIILATLLTTPAPTLTVASLKAHNAQCIKLVGRSFDRQVDAYALVNKMVLKESETAKYNRHARAGAILTESKHLADIASECIEKVQEDAQTWLNNMHPGSE